MLWNWLGSVHESPSEQRCHSDVSTMLELLGNGVDRDRSIREVFLSAFIATAASISNCSIERPWRLCHRAPGTCHS
jgi:hypothetical protein